jgi:hypothetical protein
MSRLLPLALASQLGLLAWIAGLGAPGAALAAAGGLGVGALAGLQLRERAPDAVAMLAFGGLGMTLGWWADLGLRTAAEMAAHSRAPVDLLWCRSTAGPAALAGVPALGHLLSWMNAGMLALGMPAVARTCRSARVACAAAMVAGMYAGSLAAAALATRLSPTEVVLADWLLMSSGMLGGMLVAERVPRLLSRFPGCLRSPRSPT